MRRTLGEDAKNFILKFDDLRVQRNRFEYSAIFNMSDAQLEKAMEDAGKLVEEIGKYVQSKHPQKHFNWGE